VAAIGVSIAGLRVERGGRPVLRDVSLTVSGGLITGLLGPSGCGKTTLMRAIVGVQRITRGRIDVLGLPAGTAELRRRVGYMTQSPAIYSDLTVTENLRYFGAIVGASASRSADLIELVHLEAKAHTPVHELSGGERSRVSLCVSLLGAPELLVLDEPTVGLDPLVRAELWATFHSLASESVLLLVSTHVMEEADRCDHLLLMREGQVIATGSPDEIRRQGRSSTLEAAFIAIASPR
jgi:ABC-2 type transport system ATP-binding protein